MNLLHKLYISVSEAENNIVLPIKKRHAIWQCPYVNVQFDLNILNLKSD